MRKLPIVPRWKVLNRVFKMLKNPIPSFNDYIEEFGDTFVVYVGGVKRGIFSINPDVIQHILQKGNRKYAKSPIQTDALAAYIGFGLLTTEGDYWLRQRRLIQPGFHRQKLVGLVDIMQQEVIKACASFENSALNGIPIDMNQQGMEIAFKIVATSLFSSDISDEKMNELSHSIEAVQAFFIRTIRLPFMKPIYQLTGKIKKHQQISDDIATILDELIENRRKSGQRKDDLLDMLLETRYEDTGEGMTDTQLRAESLILFVAGHETTANVITWMFYLLAQHPQVVQKLRQEFDTVVGKDELDYEDFRNIPYAVQVINESMRMYPPAWIIDRMAISDDEIDGFEVQKNDLMIPFIYGLHHSKDLWDQPEQFNPDRFSRENKKDRHPYAFLPFGGGPRLCIGNNFAIMELQLILFHLILRFDFELADQTPVDLLPMITLKPDRAIRLKVSKRKINSFF